MIRLEEFVNEKLKVTKGNVPPDIPLGEQGWVCNSVSCIYSDVHQVDDFLKSNIDLGRLYDMNTEDYIEGKVIIFDPVFKALKRRKWCTKIINLILSEYTFEDSVDKVQEILKQSTTCEYGQTSSNIKHQVIRILDSQKLCVIAVVFTKR